MHDATPVLAVSGREGPPSASQARWRCLRAPGAAGLLLSHDYDAAIDSLPSFRAADWLYFQPATRQLVARS
eukprot:scaffold347_cov380-Prasinococcus_capsulatus_cf.AAC.25